MIYHKLILAMGGLVAISLSGQSDAEVVIGGGHGAAMQHIAKMKMIGGLQVVKELLEGDLSKEPEAILHRVKTILGNF